MDPHYEVKPENGTKAYLPTGAKSQVPSRRASLLQMDPGIAGCSDNERQLCAFPALGEDDVNP